MKIVRSSEVLNFLQRAFNCCGSEAFYAKRLERSEFVEASSRSAILVAPMFFIHDLINSLIYRIPLECSSFTRVCSVFCERTLAKELFVLGFSKCLEICIRRILVNKCWLAMKMLR